MAKPAGGSGQQGPNTPEELSQHPFVERLKPDPSQPAKRVAVLTGLLDKSDRPGYQRIYLTTKLDYYSEFLTPDMVHAEAVPADQSPFPDPRNGPGLRTWVRRAHFRRAQPAAGLRWQLHVGGYLWHVLLDRSGGEAVRGLDGTASVRAD